MLFVSLAVILLCGASGAGAAALLFGLGLWVAVAGYVAGTLVGLGALAIAYAMPPLRPSSRALTESHNDLS